MESTLGGQGGQAEFHCAVAVNFLEMIHEPASSRMWHFADGMSEPYPALRVSCQMPGTEPINEP